MNPTDANYQSPTLVSSTDGSADNSLLATLPALVPSANAQMLRRLREIAKAEGKCSVCRARPARPRKLTCQDCADRVAARKQDNTDRGRCACGNRPRKGKKACAACAARHEVRLERDAIRRKAAGLCAHHGCTALREAGRAQCLPHLIESRDRAKARRARAIERGICGTCQRAPLSTKAECVACNDKNRKRSRRHRRGMAT